MKKVTFLGQLAAEQPVILEEREIPSHHDLKDYQSYAQALARCKMTEDELEPKIELVKGWVEEKK